MLVGNCAIMNAAEKSNLSYIHTLREREFCRSRYRSTWRGRLAVWGGVPAARSARTGTVERGRHCAGGSLSRSGVEAAAASRCGWGTGGSPAPLPTDSTQTTANQQTIYIRGGEPFCVRGPNKFLENIKGPQNKTRCFLITFAVVCETWRIH